MHWFLPVNDGEFPARQDVWQPYAPRVVDKHLKKKRWVAHHCLGHKLLTNLEEWSVLKS